MLEGLLMEVALEGTGKAEGSINVQAASSAPRKSVTPTAETLEERPQDGPTTEQRRKNLFDTRPSRP